MSVSEADILQPAFKSDQTEIDQATVEHIGEALSKIGVAIALFNDSDLLVTANDSFKNLHPVAPDLMVEGKSYEELVEGAVYGGAIGEDITDPQTWIDAALTRRRVQPNRVHSLRLSDGRHLLMLDSSLSTGHRLAVRADVTDLQRMKDVFVAFSKIVASRQIEPEVKIARILNLGCEQLGLPQAGVLRSDGTELIQATMYPHEGAGDLNFDNDLIPKDLKKPIILMPDGERNSYAQGGNFGGDQLQEHTLVAPITVDEEPYGYVVFSGESWRETEFGPADLDVISIFSDWIGHELAREMDLEELDRIHSQFEHQARTDELTGMANRRQFMADAGAAFEKARRLNTPLSVAIFDIDHFKTINDNFGHDIGDKLLKLVANVAADSVSDYGKIGRIGGEEFAILFEKMAPDEASKVYPSCL